MLDAYPQAPVRPIPGYADFFDEEVPAPHGRRLLAFLIDLGFFTLLLIGLIHLDGVGVLVASAVAASWVVWFFAYLVLSSGLAAATLGKWLMGLRLVGPAGYPLRRASGLFRAFIRYLVMYLLASFLGLAWWTAIGRADHRGIHDLAADTRLVLAPRSGVEALLRPILRFVITSTRRPQGT